jgi:hypothetical protein
MALHDIFTVVPFVVQVGAPGASGSSYMMAETAAAEFAAPVAITVK